MRALNEPDTSSGLLRGVRDPGNEQAWALFFKRYQPFIYRYCRSHQLSADPAAEVTQRVLVRLASKMSGFVYDPGLSFRSWLRTVIHFEVLNFRRELVRQRPDRASGDSKVARLLDQAVSR